jgi:lipoprotein NlpI
MLSIDFSNSFLAQLDLPVSPKNTNLNTELLLSLLIDMTESTTDGYRVRAEIHFARGNFLAAMQVTIIYKLQFKISAIKSNKPDRYFFNKLSALLLSIF